ncbi:MAG: glycosyltransferase [Phycisphaerae bacterium]
MQPPEFVFAGGGTGGHLFPGIAVANAVRARRPDARIHFLTTDRALDADILVKTQFTQFPQPVRPFSANPLRWPAFWRAWRRSITLAGTMIRAHPPQAVLGLGGYAAGPAVVAARALRVRSAILNPDAVPGRANRFLARRTDLVVLQWARSREHFSSATTCAALGCPIRAEFALPPDLPAARQSFGLAPERPVLLVTGASQGAQTVNAAMARVWPVFSARHADWQILHLTGVAHEREARAAYAAAGCAARVVGFTHEMWLALAASDLVVSRAGASTLAELTALGKPSVLLPYPYHRDRHQHANAQVLVDEGAAVLVEDRLTPADNAAPLLAALERFANADERARAAAAARRLARPDAADRTATWLLEGCVP